MWGLLQTKYTAKVAPLCFVTRGKFNREKSKDLPVRPCWTSSCKTWSSAKSVLFFFSASLTLSSVSLTLLLSLPCLLSLSGTCTLHLALKGVSLTRCLSFVKTKEGGGGLFWHPFGWGLHPKIVCLPLNNTTSQSASPPPHNFKRSTCRLFSIDTCCLWWLLTTGPWWHLSLLYPGQARPRFIPVWRLIAMNPWHFVVWLFFFLVVMIDTQGQSCLLAVSHQPSLTWSPGPINAQKLGFDLLLERT